MSNIVKAVVINDLHFGIDATQRMYSELHQFTDFLKEKEGLQLLVFDGDYFDRKLSVMDTATYLAVKFFDEVLKICKEKGIVVRMVNGTRSHELDQIHIFESHESDDDVDFRIIRTVQEEGLLGMHVLYIPEEYPDDEQAYYADFKEKEKRYNVIFGHGTWDFVSFDSQIAHASQTNTKSAPVFMYDEWKHTIPEGFITFGHIHGRNVYGNKIYYCGSFSRWGFGERSARGFTYFEYDLDEKKYKVEFIDNTEAPTYEEISVKTIEGIDFENQDIEKITKAIDFEIAKNDYTAIDLTGLSEENIAILKKAYQKNPNIKIKAIAKSAKTLNESVEKAEEFAKYSYITKKTLPLNQTVQKFCKEDLNTEIELDKIDKILEEDK